MRCRTALPASVFENNNEEAGMTKAATLATLSGRRILVAEDDYMIAEGIAEMLSEAGAEALGPAPTVADAARFVAAEERMDAALLDVNLRGERIWPVVDALLAREVPVVLSSGYDEDAIPPAYAHLPRCGKPATGRAIAHALVCMLAPA